MKIQSRPPVVEEQKQTSMTLDEIRDVLSDPKLKLYELKAVLQRVEGGLYALEKLGKIHAWGAYDIDRMSGKYIQVLVIIKRGMPVQTINIHL